MKQNANLIKIILIIVTIFINSCVQIVKVNLSYTPLIQVQRLADKTNPQIVVVDKFNDARIQTTLTRYRWNPFNVYVYWYESDDDINNLVRKAFVDALSKTGFDVPIQSKQGANPLLHVAGKIITYKADIKSGWDKATLTADVAIELTITPNTGSPITILLQGQRTIVQDNNLMNPSKNLPEQLDFALQDCVKKLLEDDRFLGLVKS